MSENEAVRDPLDVAADEVAELLAERKAGDVTWERLIESLAEKAQQAQRRYMLAQRMQAAFAGRVMMHDRLAGSFEYPKCHETEPIPEGTNDAARKRGVPCPKCNGPATDPEGKPATA